VLSGNALSGGKSYEDYLKEQSPNVVLLRYGAADAIRLNDPAKTLANLQQMVDLAKQYGATPILIGVSPFAAGNDIRAGNINEWSVDPYINSANAINSGIQQLAGQNQLPFVDVRSLEAPKGSLLDGVHPTADFGKQMADFIGQNVAAALPQFQFGAAPTPAPAPTPSPTPAPTPTPAPSSGGIAGLVPALQTSWNGSGGVGADTYQAAPPAPAVAPTPIAVGATQDGGLKSLLPSGWETYNPQQKIGWFNQNQVTTDQLLNANAGVTKEDIDWMKGQGYLGAYQNAPAKPPTVVNPVTANTQAPQNNVTRVLEELQRQPRKEAPVPLPDEYRRGGRVRMI
jgi:hypothetical protein